ncbi:MAG: YajQ family cyclic di-GMP-binding protein [Deltaproteobacteria bacterium]|nr:YajQ family cyclic di-GMP-binding protein [Deltaproteobacteria bacterium]
MPSFDIVSQVDLQEVDNAVNNVKKEVAGRFDFRTIPTDIDFNRKDKKIRLVTGSEMHIRALRDMLIAHLTRRKVDSRILEFKDPEPTSQGRVKQEIGLQEGIDKDTARKIVQLVKASKLKVQTAIQDEQVRVTGKKIDDLQAVIRLVDEAGLERPLQHVNMKN